MRFWAKFMAIVAIATGIQAWVGLHPEAVEDSLFTLRVAMWRPLYEQPTDEVVDAARMIMERQIARHFRELEHHTSPAEGSGTGKVGVTGA